MKINFDVINRFQFMVMLEMLMIIVIRVRLFRWRFWWGIGICRIGFRGFSRGRLIRAFLLLGIFIIVLVRIILVVRFRLRIAGSFIISGFLIHCSFCTYYFQIFSYLKFRIRSIGQSCLNSSQAINPYLFIVLPNICIT